MDPDLHWILLISDTGAAKVGPNCSEEDQPTSQKGLHQVNAHSPEPGFIL